MSFSPQETARSLIGALREAHRVSNEMAVAGGVMETNACKAQVEYICSSMNKAHAALQLLQTAYSNAVIATRIADHIEPAPADLAASYTAARNAWITMANNYGSVVLPDMGSPWTWNTTARTHGNALYDIDRTANFRANIIALRDALAVFG